MSPDGEVKKEVKKEVTRVFTIQSALNGFLLVEVTEGVGQPMRVAKDVDELVSLLRETLA